MSTPNSTVDFLRAVLPSPHGGERIEARLIRPDGHAISRFYTTPESLVTDITPHIGKRHIYFGVNLRRGGGRAENITRVGTLHADIDTKLFGGDDKATLAAIEQFPVRPSIVVASGAGYQPYWLLQQPHDAQQEQARIEEANAAIARAVCGPNRSPDHVQDIGRILRLPGTLNVKYDPSRGVTLAWCEPCRYVTLESVETFLSEHYPWSLQVAEEQGRPSPTSLTEQRKDYLTLHPSTTDPQALRERAERGWARAETLRLLDTAEDGRYQSESHADSAIAAALIRAGLTAPEALAVLLVSARGEAAKERKGERHWLRYWQLTVTEAAIYVGPVTEHADGTRVRSLPQPRKGTGRKLPEPIRPQGTPLPTPQRPTGVPLPTPHRTIVHRGEVACG